MTDTARPGRDREATERRLLDAARQVLADSGFNGFGINAVARQAGCDKQLIYRYFGGLDGLLDAIGTDLADWWALRMQPVEALGRPDSYAEMIRRMALCLLQALREDVLMRRIIAWELSSSSPHVQQFSRSRSMAMAAWMQKARGDLAPPEDLDAAATNAILIAAIQHIVLAADMTGGFAGLPLKTDADWDRLRDRLKRIIDTLYA